MIVPIEPRQTAAILLPLSEPLMRSRVQGKWQAVEILDPYGDGLVTFDEFRLAVLPGEPLRAMRLGGFGGVGGVLKT